MKWWKMYSKSIENIKRIIIEKPSWFSTAEGPCSINDVARIEENLDAKLPMSFSLFSTTFGGGYFGRINVSSLKVGSEWCVLSRPVITNLDGNHVLIVSDDESGGYYFHKKDNYGYSDKVYYMYYDEANSLKLAYDDFFSFVLDMGLSF